MKPYFSDQILVTISKEELYLLRTAVANLAWQNKDKDEYYKDLKKLQDDIFTVIRCFPF